MECWKDVMIEPLTDRLVEHVLSEIERHRNGEMIYHDDALTAVLSLVTVDQYKKKNALQVVDVFISTIAWVLHLLILFFSKLLATLACGLW